MAAIKKICCRNNQENKKNKMNYILFVKQCGIQYYVIESLDDDLTIIIEFLS